MATTIKPAFKLGIKVSHTKHGTGKVVELNHAKNGLWVSVEFGDKKNPNVKRVRVGTLTKV